MTELYKNFKCPICNAPVRCHQFQGSLMIECSAPRCRWEANESIPEEKSIAVTQRPKQISRRQWYQATVKGAVL